MQTQTNTTNDFCLRQLSKNTATDENKKHIFCQILFVEVCAKLKGGFYKEQKQINI